MDEPAEPVPVERPILLCLVVRADWHRGDNPAMLMRRDHGFAVIDFLALPDYRELGWEFVALDPDSELAWKTWRAHHPEAS